MVVIVLLAGMSDFDLSAYMGQWYEYSNMFEIYQDVFAGLTFAISFKNFNKGIFCGAYNY